MAAHAILVVLSCHGGPWDSVDFVMAWRPMEFCRFCRVVAADAILMALSCHGGPYHFVGFDVS